MTIKWRPNGRSEDKTMISPERSSQRPILSLAVEMRLERPYG